MLSGMKVADVSWSPCSAMYESISSVRDKVDSLSAFGLVGGWGSRRVESVTERLREEDEASDSMERLRCRFRLGWRDKSL